MAKVIVTCVSHTYRNGEVVRCGKEGHVSTMKQVHIPSKGICYFCEDCYNAKFGYHTKNNLRRTIQSNHGFTYGVEFEMTAHGDYTRLLAYYGWLPTYDSTVTVEYKGHIMGNLSGLKQMFRSLENNIDFREHFGSACGTHCNIGHTDYINETTIGYIRRFYHSLFVDFSDMLVRNEEACTKIYGRSLGRWCQPINTNTTPTNHANFINVEKDNRIEFRTSKFASPEQYVDLMTFNRKIMEIVIKWFIIPFNENTTTLTDSEYRKALAKKTSDKICKLFIKEADKHSIIVR